MEVLLLFVMGAINILCFLAGAKVGQAVVNGEKVELPTVNPIEAARSHISKKEAQMDQDRMDVILRNIERYDGTSLGQEDVPGR